LPALFNEQAAPGHVPASQVELRLKIDGLISAAMHTMQSAASRPVTILLSDLRGFTAVAEKYTALEMVAGHPGSILHSKFIEIGDVN
jgi:hypothetical protein